MTRGRSLVALSAAVLTIGIAAPAGAQTKPLPTKEPPAAAAGAEPKPRPSTGSARADGKAAGRKVVRLEELRVEGRIQKPQALILMPRASVAPAEPDRTESFLSKVKDATQKDPF